MGNLRKHYLIILLALGLSIGFWILNCSITLPFSGVLYWDYARHLQAANLDSPYMLPLIIKAYTLLFGTSALAFGYISFLFFVITMLVMYAIAYPLYGRKVALLTAVMFCALPVQSKFFAHLDYHLAVIMLFCCLLLMLTYWQRTQLNRYLLLSGAFLGMLLMTQMESFILAACLMLASFCVSDYRVLWRKPVFYISLLIALCFTVPFLIWQTHHHWATFHYLLTSNGDPRDAVGFFQALGDYCGSLGFFLLLTMIVLWRTRGIQQLNANSRFFLYLWIFIFIALTFVFMYNYIRHATMINANCVLFLFLAGNAYRLFPRLTIIFTTISLIASTVYIIISLMVSYNDNSLSFTDQIQPLVKANTLIISDVEPYDNAPSFFAINLKGQPEVYAYKEDLINFHNKNNPAVYLWQPHLKQLMAETQGQDVLVLTKKRYVPRRLEHYLQCQPARALTITIHTARSVDRFLKHGMHEKHITIYAHPCIKW